jgi:outer membrane receptor for ferrienterochelin and colicins
MRHLLCLLPAFIFLLNAGNAQDISVRGVVMEEKLDGTLVPIEFANVYWLRSTNSTTTDSTGYFFIAHGPTDGDQLIFQFLGFDPDTVKASPGQYLSVLFREEASVLGEVVVVHRKRTTEVSFLDPLQVQNISKEELFKAACCNLSESFETNATVDVSFTDAVTGAKEIQMLGLSGKYTLISQEQMPGVRGIAIPYGLLYTPGAWVESIQISKGAGSVVQGYESMTGQINVELKKPFDEDKLLINGFFGESYRSELNIFTRANVSPMFSTALMGHVSLYPTEHDRNDDGFMDMPTGSLITLANRWDYHNNKSGLEGQLNVQWVQDRKEGGQTSHGHDTEHLYRTTIDGDRLQAVAKVGYIFPKKRYNSIGSQWGFTRHVQSTTIGQTLYDAAQTSLYGNWLYQSILGDSRHKYVTGLSFRYEDYQEQLDIDQYDFREIVPGAFFEYTYIPDDRLTAVGGLRVDYHNIYGWLINPRIHLRYAPNEALVFRLSAGSGMRTPLPIAENLGWLASSRDWTIGEPGQTQNDFPYNGLEMEKAWNFGASVTKEFTLDYRSGLVSVDFFHTRFSNRAIADLDISPQQLWIYNLDGESYANTFQVEAQYEILKRVDLKVAYKLQDAQIAYREQGMRQQIFTPSSRFFVNLAYVSSVATYKGHWRFSVTAHNTGAQRIPDTYTNPVAFQLDPNSPDYWLFNGQITRVFSKHFEVYVGVENVGNYKQDPVIVDSADPYSPYFDAGLIWGPIFGREWYVGFRYMLK